MQRQLLPLLGRYVLLAAGLIVLNFLLPRLLPGDPLAFSSGSGTDPAVPLSSAAKAQIRAYYRLNEPVSRQFAGYLADLARGDLGWSIARPAPVRTLIADRLPWTLGLLLTALLISALCGTAAGIIAGWRPGTKRDRVIVAIASGTAAMPEFLVATGLLLTFAVGFGWFPLYGGRTLFAPNHGTASFAKHALDIAWHLTLPAISLSLAGSSAFIILSRDVIAAIQHEGWLVTARAKGLPDWQIARRHALPNVVMPLLTFFGLRLGALFGGALVVERVFGVPGLGWLGFEAIRARDYPVLQALFFLSGLGVLTANLALEIISAWLLTRRGQVNG